MDQLSDPTALAAICLALFFGGVLKGAIGMGAPVIAVPVMVSFIDVRLAVVLMVIPNLFTNAWQLWTYRAARLSGPFSLIFAVAGAVGVSIGSLVLVSVSAISLKILVAAAVLIYVLLRLLRPDFVLSIARAQPIAAPIGVMAGFLQGAAGISAPISASFLNALQLAREAFIFTISLFFVGMCCVQIPLLIGLGLMTPQTVVLGVAILLPLLIGMPIGGRLSRMLSPAIFDRVILGVLTLLAFKLLADAAFGL